MGAIWFRGSANPSAERLTSGSMRSLSLTGTLRCFAAPRPLAKRYV